MIFVGTAFVRSRWTWLGGAIGAYAFTAILLVAGHSPSASGPLVTGPINLDEFAQTMRWLGLLTGLVTTLAVSKQADVRLIGEVVGSIMIAAAGIMIVSSANELVTLFLGLELISIPTYILLFLGRRDAASGEATMKYFFLSILSSSFMLYGFSFLYGVGGTTWLAGTEHFPGIRESLAGTGPTAADPALLKFVPLAMILIVAGLAFKLTAVPFHFYAPDVYQGTTNANAGLLAVAPKIAGVVALARILLVAIPITGISGLGTWQLAVVLSLVTMTVGNVCALWQTNIRRMLAYSSIAHAGYILIGFAAAAVPTGSVGAETFNGGLSAVVFYTVVYALASLGIFSALTAVSTPDKEVSTLDEIAGLAKSRPVIAAVIAICLFSLAGLPPLAGFWGKLQLFLGAVSLATNAEVPAAQLWFTILSITATGRWRGRRGYGGCGRLAGGQ